MEDILVPLGLFGMVVAIVAINVAGSASRRKAVLATVQEAIRSGQQLSPETIKALGVQEKPKGGDLKAGSILLAVAAALVSSLTGLALPADCVYFGEVSLSGAVRPVAQTALRLKEAEKLGFHGAVLPSGSAEVPAGKAAGLTMVESLPDLVARIAGSKGDRLSAGAGEDN